MPRGEDEAVPVDPLRIGRIVAKELSVEDGAHFGRAERQAQVAGGRSVNGVHRETAGDGGGGGELGKIGHRHDSSGDG